MKLYSWVARAMKLFQGSCSDQHNTKVFGFDF